MSREEMATAPAQAGGRLVRLGSSALLAQGISSSGNLLAGAVVARFLGASALGAFAVLFATLLWLVALQTSWVGDSMTVLGGRSLAVRKGVVTMQMWFTCGGALVGAAIAALATDIGFLGVAAFAFLVGAWQLEEYGRRVFMARLEFLRLAVNDGTYLLTLIVSLTALGLGPGLSLNGVIWAMAVSSAAAFVSGIFAMPSASRLYVSFRWNDGIAVVAKYGFWRAAQSGVGLLSGLGARLVLSGLVSVTLLGEVEAARLVCAPLFVGLAASSNVLLSLFVHIKNDDNKRRRAIRGAAALSAGLAVLYGIVVLAIPGPIIDIVAGGQFVADRVVLSGWLLQALVLGLGNPVTSVALVRGRAASVFWLKLAGAVASFALAYAAVLSGHPTWVPAAIAAGQALSTLLLHRANRKHEASPQPVQVEVEQEAGLALERSAS